ncbi:uncharacterized protein BDV17DRAFT_16514 [Aspergillus undulatus]|uniref:uncharacterized protein n=1 Tax=Aspergillus undulatus TaxID=1810928 RepID=UPI003CCD48EC
MNSWRSPSNTGDDPSSSPYTANNGWPTPRSQPSPGRREYAMQVPPLTTSFNNHQFQGQGLGVGLGAGYLSTPLSTTSLSSPFTQSPAVNSAGMALGSSPMASRQYNAPYNPQDWGPVHHGPVSANQSPYSQSGNMVRIVPQHRYAEPELSSPPPPYSPPSQQQQHADHATHTTPVLHSTSPDAGSPYMGSRQQSIPRTRPVSVARTDTGHNRQVSLPPPPPLPQGAPSSRSSSHNRADVYHEQSSYNAGSRPYIMVSEDNLHHSQPQAQLQPQATSYGHQYASLQRDDSSRAPNSRRAVSAGPVVGSASASRATSQSRSRSPPQHPAWEPGMPLPPPPPGPPPVPRSQSVNGLSDASSSRSSHVPTRTARQPPSLGTGLGSVPPTPAGWVDEGNTGPTPKPDRAPLNIDTSSQGTSRDTNGSGSSGTAHPSRNSMNRNSVNGGLFRSPAVRDTSAKGIRERRTERRNRQSQVFDDYSAVSNSTNPWADALDQLKPSNLIFDDHHAAENSRSDAATRHTTPRSNHSVTSDMPTSQSRASSTSLFSSNRSPFSTPRGAEPSPLGSSHRYAQTPPFSPNPDQPSTYQKISSQAIPPKALPTPPLQPGQDSRPPSGSGRREDRPVSHILHLPNDTVSSPTLQPRRPSLHRGQSLDSVVNQDTELIQSATKRHKEFIEKEASATDEAEALRLFTEYIITETQVRRERYAKIFDAGSFNLEQFQQKLFQLPPKPAPEPINRRSLKGPRLDIPTTRGESSWNNYKPCLSPIASLGISNDESSRGRAPSRWWESRTGSGSEGGERRIQRSKRESKYMGLPLGLRSNGSAEHTDDPFNPYAGYGPDEYPPEKVGWHEDQALPEYLTPSQSSFSHSTSTEPQKMDVSRLITLPPPYPRHYPAVNNSHPDLITYRTLVRSISDHSEIKSTRQRHASETETLWAKHNSSIKDSRRQFKSNIQSQIADGSITFAEAAEAEAALLHDENARERTLTKQLLDSYQDTVLNPLQAILTDRIDRASTCISDLQSKLLHAAAHETPDQSGFLEEGDEKPELLEKLTQLKWLFEAREQLHRELYDLITTRDEKYKDLVILPYRQTSNTDKIASTTAFFVKDALDRKVHFEENALSRLESFQSIIEENVVRGVETHLSAFWDIAPSLNTLVQSIPNQLSGFQIQIPATEYDENPSYVTHPLQYLYTLVSHAEKSSYQYIESQINLLCLLHEVKSAVMRGRCKLLETERIRRGESEEVVSREIEEVREKEERSLTGDLKEKVATVEGQWSEALGSQIGDLRGRVRGQLERDGGWEEMESLETA